MGEEDAESGPIHDEIEIEDFKYDPETDTFQYPCPCGDEFLISREELMEGGKYAKCPSCSLMVLVIYNPDDLKSIIEVKSAKETRSKETASGVRVTS